MRRRRSIVLLVRPHGRAMALAQTPHAATIEADQAPLGNLGIRRLVRMPEAPP